MKARTALLKLFKESSEWRAFFSSCCETSTFRLRSQVWQFRNEFKDRGNAFQADEVEDSLLGLARELLPSTPAAQWDAEWAHELCKDALARLAKRYAELSTADREPVDLSGQGVWDERMDAAGLANDPVAFRVALKGRTRAGLETMEHVQHQGRCRMTLSIGEGDSSITKGGPATQEGKEVVRGERNPTRRPLPCPGRPWSGGRRRTGRSTGTGFSRASSPEGHLELVLAERVALLSWRLNRVIRYETESIALFQEKAEDDLA